MHQFIEGVPIYQQIAGTMKHRMISGRLKPGDKLPSVREIAEEFSVNPNTVQRVFMELEKDGLTYAERGVGTFLKEDPTMVDRLKEAEAQQLRTRFIRDAASLGLTLEEILRDLTAEWPQGGDQT